MELLEGPLRKGALALGLDLSAAQLKQLLDYLGLLQKWGRVYNLTAVREPGDMLTQHLLDSLAVVPPLCRHLAGHPEPAAAHRLLDVGSGAGLPGVVIAICCPDLDVSCVDTVAKKTAFIQQAAAGLRLSNLHAIHARVENRSEKYQVLVSRAFASLADFTRLTAGALAPGGMWMAMKGKRPDEELAALSPQIRVFHVEQLQVPGLDAHRCLVWMGRATG